MHGEEGKCNAWGGGHGVNTQGCTATQGKSLHVLIITTRPDTFPSPMPTTVVIR